MGKKPEGFTRMEELTRPKIRASEGWERRRGAAHNL